MQIKKLLELAVAALLAGSLASCNIGKAPAPTTDVNAVYTSVASTMIADLNDQLTQTAQAIPPTALASPTELPTLPPLPSVVVESTLTPINPANTSVAIGSSASPILALSPAGGTPVALGTTSTSNAAVGCADSIFIADITIPDGTAEKPGAVFTKRWRMQNTGTCTWGSGFKFAFAYGSRMGGGDFTISRKYDFVAPGGTKDIDIVLTAPTVPNTYTGCWKMQTDQGYFFGGVACVTIKVA
ncbi:MAG TPA: NBR1-Ig-like domain-containing protein [Anaerolineales bacterium]|nr:NBR1-Ig-like domain-containing protein [Anaerolineales bacterium]